MNLIPWRSSNLERRIANPMQSLQQDIERLFDHFSQFGRDDFTAPLWAAPFYPRMDVQESDSGMQLTAELPGMTEKDVDISVSDGNLYLRGEKKSESDRSGPGWQTSERSYGKFERTIALGADLDGDKAQASYKNGVLTISVPRKEGVKRNVRKIKVSAEH